MNRNEYIDTLVFGNQMVNVGQDDYGQCYFLEWAEDDELKQEGCGTYNFNYREYAEGKFGIPEEHCPYYPKEDFPPLNECKNKNSFGYCFKCKYHDIEDYAFRTLVELGVTDRRGNLIGPWNDILVKRKEDTKDENK